MERHPVRIEAVVYRANIEGVLSTVVDDDDEGDEHMIVGFINCNGQTLLYMCNFMRSCRHFNGKQMAKFCLSTNTCEMFYVLF